MGQASLKPALRVLSVSGGVAAEMSSTNPAKAASVVEEIQAILNFWLEIDLILKKSANICNSFYSELKNMVTLICLSNSWESLL